LFKKIIKFIFFKYKYKIMPPKSSPKKKSPPRPFAKKPSGVKRKPSSITLAQKKKILATAALLVGAGAAAYKVRSVRKASKASDAPKKSNSIFTWPSMFSFGKKKATAQVAPGTNPDNFLG
jgi:hypothetical protein